MLSTPRRPADGCTAGGCGTQNTVTVDGVHGRRCADHPPTFEPRRAVALAMCGDLAGALSYCRTDLTPASTDVGALSCQQSGDESTQRQPDLSPERDDDSPDRQAGTEREGRDGEGHHELGGHHVEERHQQSGPSRRANQRASADDHGRQKENRRERRRRVVEGAQVLGHDPERAR